MKTARIIQFGDPILREQAEPVTAFHKKLRQRIEVIRQTLEQCDNGAALAATQIALPKRIVVIDYMDEYIELVNPVILSSSGSFTEYEGCLSLPGYVGRVERAETVTVRFQDRQGNEHTITRTREMARCLQHEIDHLDGILFIDRTDDEYLINPDDDTKLSVKLLLNETGVKKS